MRLGSAVAVLLMFAAAPASRRWSGSFYFEKPVKLPRNALSTLDKTYAPAF